ncbi:hypothetical protein E2320_015763 [Naja naja]|nr:hypothetical protein E2320_015763 [Naja naja]
MLSQRFASSGVFHSSSLARMSATSRSIRLSTLLSVIPFGKCHSARLWISAPLSSAYVIPVLILSFTYLKTIRYLWTSVDPMKVMSDSKKGKRKVTRMIIIVTVLFCLCWLPHHLVILCFWFGNFPLNNVTFVLRVLSHLISYANSCVNPIVYALVSKHFRKGFKKIFSCLLHKRVTNKVHVAQVTHTVSTLEADLTEVIDVNEPVHTEASTCCHIPVQTWNKAEQLSHQEKAANSFITFNVT